MPSPLPEDTVVSWEVVVIEVTLDGLLSPNCQGCQGPLDIHQPDENYPTRLLGTCGQCGVWHMIELGTRGPKALMFSLPPAEFVRAKLGEIRKALKPKRYPRRKPEVRRRRNFGQNVS